MSSVPVTCGADVLFASSPRLGGELDWVPELDDCDVVVSTTGRRQGARPHGSWKAPA